MNKGAASDIEMSEGLKLRSFTALIFLPDSYPILLHRAAAALQTYTTSSDVGYTRSSNSAFSHPSTNFYRESKSVKFGLDLRHPALFFEWALISKRSNASVPTYHIWCCDVGTMFSPNLVQFGPPSLMGRVLKIHPLEKIG